MSLFGKIKSAVMGNPVTREYEIGKHVASAGPGLLWKVHNGIKKTTRQEVSVFIYEKKSPEAEKIPKKHREALLAMLKKGPTQLIRLKHPRLLTIEHQLQESSDTLAFVTEPVVASLANVLGQYDNLPTPLPLAIKEHELHSVEIQYGILQLSEALDFLHSDAKMLHGNVSPESVAVASSGAWKLMGFNFSSFSQYQSEAQVSFAFREWDSRGSIFTNPCLDYLAPEYILNKACSQASDVFSFGMLCFAVYNEGKPLFSSHNNTLTFKHNAEQISRVTETTLAKVPASFKHTVRSMLAIEPAVRPDALQISKNEFFEEAGVSTLKYLDMLFERSDMEKSQFFKKNLARTIRLLPKRVVHQRVLPALAGEFRNHKMIPFILPLVLLVAEDCSIQEYGTLIMPVLIPALKVQEPVQIPLIFLQKMDLLLKKTSQDNVKAHILPLIISSLESQNSQLQELCVSILPSFAGMVDYSSMKHSIIPRVVALALSSREPPPVIKCLVCIGQMLDILDKHIVLDVVLPMLESIPLRDAGVLMAVLGIYHETLKNKKLGIDKMMLATRVVPLLLPLSIEPSLNIKQFNQFMLVIREMLVKVESEHQTYLDQLSKMEEQTQSTVEFAREVAEQKAIDDAVDKIEDIFGGGSKPSDVVARKGTSLPVTTSTVTSTIGGPTDLLADLTVGDMAASLSSKPSPSPSSTHRTTAMQKTSTQQSKVMYTSNQTPPQKPASRVISFAKQSEPFGTWESPSTSEPLRPTSSNVPLQPQQAGSVPLQPQQAGSVPLQPQPVGSSFTPVASQAISSTYKPPMSQSKVSSGNTSLQRNSGYKGASLLTAQTAPSNDIESLFSGMQVSPQASQTSNPQFARSSGPPGAQGSQQQGPSSQGTIFSGMDINSGSVAAQSLVPTPAPHSNPNPMGWSSSVGGDGVQNSNSSAGGNPTGWSSNVDPNRGNLSTGWSSNVNPNRGNLSTGWSSSVNPSASNLNPNSGWSSGVNPSTGWSQGVDAGSGMQQYGSGPGRYMHNNMGGGMSSVGTGTGLQQSPSVMHKTNRQATSGSNPFADLNFLG